MVDELERYRGAGGQSLGRETLHLLARHQLPTSPPNYEIWINHASGANAALSREIETLLASGAALTDEVSASLFDRFFANTRLTVELVETSECIARELSGVVSTLRHAGAQTETYADSLQQAATSFESTDPVQLRGVIASLAAATREMAANNRQLAEQMQLSSRQVETLQTALQNVKIEALTDSLTGLANRRLFDETLRRRVGETNGDEAGLCLVMCDIDHFKRFNDTWGHLVGDQVIRFIANVLRQHAQGDAVAARYGGEEFAIVLPRMGLREAQALAGAVHQAIRSTRLTRRSTGDTLGAVTVSIGIAQHRRGESMTDFIGRADTCLYASKRGGRDRITTDTDDAALSAA